MKPSITAAVCACMALALLGCGSSSDGESTPTQAPAEASASATEAPASAQAASEVCAARDDIQAQVQTLTTLSAGSATKADVTTALTAITADVQKMTDAQAALTPERKQQVQEAVTAFGTELEAIAREAVAGLATTDAKTQAETAAASLKSAVTESLQPIEC